MNIVDVDWNMYLKQKGLYCQNEEQSNDESVQVQDNFSAWFRKGLYSLKIVFRSPLFFRQFQLQSKSEQTGINHL